MDPIRTTRIMETLIGIEEGMTEEGMIEEGITIAIVMSLSGVGLAGEEEIHLIHPIHSIRTTMTSTDTDAPTRITTTNKTDIETTVETDLDS